MATARNKIAREEGFKIKQSQGIIRSWQEMVTDTITTARRRGQIIDLADALELLTLGVAMTTKADGILDSVKIEHEK